MLRAIKDRVIVKRSEEQRTTASGIVLQRDISEQVFAIALDIGPEVKSDIQVGDQLVVDWRQVAVMPFEGNKFYLVAEQDILAIVEEL